MILRSSTPWRGSPGGSVHHLNSNNLLTLLENHHKWWRVRECKIVYYVQKVAFVAPLGLAGLQFGPLETPRGSKIDENSSKIKDLLKLIAMEVFTIKREYKFLYSIIFLKPPLYFPLDF